MKVSSRLTSNQSLKGTVSRVFGTTFFIFHNHKQICFVNLCVFHKDIRNFRKDISNFLKDIRNFRKDIRNFLKDIRNFRKDIRNFR